ncbi:MAG: DUF4402 domain-containing protein [Bacteroidales bacterium]|jgi:hypothetical protein
MNRKGLCCLFLLVVLITGSSRAYGQDSDKGKRWLEFDLSRAQLFFGTLLPYSTQSATVHMQVTSPGPPPSINYTQSGNILWQYNQATVAKIGVKSGGNNINLFSISIPQKNINLTSGSAYLQLKLDNPIPDHFSSLKKTYQYFYVGGELSVNNTKPGGTYTGYYNVVFNYY